LSGSLSLGELLGNIRNIFTKSTSSEADADAVSPYGKQVTPGPDGASAK
jgi:hypothetical protein